MVNRVVLLFVAAICAVPAGTMADDLADARKAFEQARENYVAALDEAIKESEKGGDAERVKDLEHTKASVALGIDTRSIAGRWSLDYTNGAHRTYLISPNGRVRFVEEKKDGMLVRRGRNLLLAFGKRNVETLRLEPAIVIDHYNPPSLLGKSPPTTTAVGVRVK